MPMPQANRIFPRSRHSISTPHNSLGRPESPLYRLWHTAFARRHGSKIAGYPFKEKVAGSSPAPGPRPRVAQLAEHQSPAKAALPRVARTTDHLSALFGYRKQLKGKATAAGTAPV